MQTNWHTADGTGQLQKLTVYGYNGDTLQAEWRAIVYADSAGSPGNILALGDLTDTTGISSGAWVDLPFSGSDKIVVEDGITYWLGVVVGGATASFRLSTSTGTDKNLWRWFGIGPVSEPDPAGSPSTQRSGRTASIYVTYDDAILLPGEDEDGGGATNGIKVWDGTAWVVKPVKVWNGSAWETKTLKRWDGSAWQLVEY